MAGMLLGGFAGHEDELAIADADLVARVKFRRPFESAAVKIGAVLGGDVVQLKAVAGVDDDGTVPARYERVLHDHIVVRRPADGVEAGAEWVDIFLVYEPASEAGRHTGGEVFNEGEGIGRSPAAVEVLACQGLHPPSVEDGFARTPKVLPPGCFEMDTVKAWVNHDKRNPSMKILSA